MPVAVPSVEVFKFGGASLADAAAVRRALDIIVEPRKTRIVAVVSALAGVTDALLALANIAREGDVRDIDGDISALHRRHRDIASSIARTERARRAIVHDAHAVTMLTEQP